MLRFFSIVVRATSQKRLFVFSIAARRECGVSPSISIVVADYESSSIAISISAVGYFSMRFVVEVPEVT